MKGKNYLLYNEKLKKLSIAWTEILSGQKCLGSIFGEKWQGGVSDGFESIFRQLFENSFAIIAYNGRH